MAWGRSKSPPNCVLKLQLERTPGALSQHVALLCMSNQQQFWRRLFPTIGQNDSCACHGQGGNSPATKGRATGQFVSMMCLGVISLGGRMRGNLSMVPLRRDRLQVGDAEERVLMGNPIWYVMVGVYGDN